MAGLGLGAVALAVSAGEPPGPSPRIVNGVLESQWPTAGALLSGTNLATAFPICSGTLIGRETFLTAAHCVCSGDGQSCTNRPPNPGSYSVFLPHAGLFSVSSISLRTDYDFPVADVAVLKLAAPVSGISPTPINTIQSPPFSTSGTIVGFGTSGGASDDSGLKRSGDVVTASCTGGVSNQTSALRCNCRCACCAGSQIKNRL